MGIVDLIFLVDVVAHGWLLLVFSLKVLRSLEAHLPQACLNQVTLNLALIVLWLDDGLLRVMCRSNHFKELFFVASSKLRIEV